MSTITAHALLGRINRRLGREHYDAIRKVRPGRAFDELGPYYRLDTERNAITDRQLSVADLVDIGRERGVLNEREAVVT